MGLAFGMGLIIFLIVLIPTLLFLVFAISFFIAWIVTHKKGLWIPSLVSFLLFLPFAFVTYFASILVIGPLEYGGLI